jgi:hypothetical protein
MEEGGERRGEQEDHMEEKTPRIGEKKDGRKNEEFPAPA